MAPVDPVELNDDRLLLRLARPEDVDQVAEACQDPEIQRWVPVPVPYERNHAAEWVASRPAQWAEDKELNWVVTDRADGRLLGTVGLHSRDNSMREVGFWAAPWARGKGVTTDAVRMVCRWGFDELRLGRIEWWAVAGNWASRRVAEKVGFTVEGSCRSALLHRDTRQDGWIAGLLPGDLR